VIDSRIVVISMVWRALMTGTLLVQLSFVAAQTEVAQQTVVHLPRASVSRIPSPDGAWTLVFECLNDCSEKKLSIEDSVSHTRRLIGKYERSLDVSWAPDSHLFFVNDFYGSNGADSSVHDPATLKTTDLADILVTGDPDALQFLKAGHRYLEAKRWLNSRALLVILYGHFDAPPAHGFSLQYQIGLDRSVHKISQRPREEP
jgi:hypothetical protein